MFGNKLEPSHNRGSNNKLQGGIVLRPKFGFGTQRGPPGQIQSMPLNPYPILTTSK